MLMGNVPLPWFYAPARAVATLATSLSGIPAGLLAPSLSVGAGLGQIMADTAGQPAAAPLAILGMCGYLAGVTQAPLTSFVIVMEMTAQHAMLLPLMVTAAIATTVSKLLSPPLYRTLALRYLQSAVLTVGEAPQPLEILKDDPVVARPDELRAFEGGEVTVYGLARDADHFPDRLLAQAYHRRRATDGR